MYFEYKANPIRGIKKGRIFMESSTAGFVQFFSAIAKFVFLEWRLGNRLYRRLLFRYARNFLIS